MTMPSVTGSSHSACVHDILQTFADSAGVSMARRAHADRNAARIREYLAAIEVPECPETLEAFAAALVYVPRQVQRLGITPLAETVAAMLDASEAVATLYYADPAATLSFEDIVRGHDPATVIL